MPALDSTTNTFIDNVTAVNFADGAGSPATMDLGLRDETIGWTETGRAVVESMNAGRRVGNGIVNETSDGKCSGSLRFQVATWRSSTAHSMRDFLTGTGTATTLTSVGTGTAFRVAMNFVYTADDGTLQTANFPAVHFHTCEVTVVDGKTMINAQWVAYCNRPAIS